MVAEKGGVRLSDAVETEVEKIGRRRATRR
jgi:hypothetical protein